MVAFIAVIIWVIGLLMYVLATNEKIKWLGLIIFGCGFLVFTEILGRSTTKLF